MRAVLIAGALTKRVEDNMIQKYSNKIRGLNKMISSWCYSDENLYVDLGVPS